MFGKKQRRIEELEQKVDGFESLLPYVPLAEEIQRRLDAFSDEVEASGSPSVYVDSLVPTMTEEGRVSYLRDIFQKMPFHEQVETLQRYYGDDDTIRQILASQRAELIKAQERDKTEATRKKVAEQLRESVDRDGIVDLGAIATGNTIRLDLKYNDKAFGRVSLTGRTMDEPGKVHVTQHGPLRDGYDHEVENSHKMYIKPHNVARIGTVVIDGKQRIYEATLFRGVEGPHIEYADKSLITSGYRVVGFRLNSEQIFADN